MQIMLLPYQDSNPLSLLNSGFKKHKLQPLHIKSCLAVELEQSIQDKLYISWLKDQVLGFEPFTTIPKLIRGLFYASISQHKFKTCLCLN